MNCPDCAGTVKENGRDNFRCCRCGAEFEQMTIEGVLTRMEDNIIILDTLRIERQRPRKCTCDVRKFEVDTVNREITCGCGMVVDPFEAMEYLASHFDRLNADTRAMYEQRKQWAKEKPHSVIFKRLEEQYQRGKMIPRCPKCDELFDFKDVEIFGNAEFYRKLEQKGQKQNK